jgi:hypothetical protein
LPKNKRENKSRTACMLRPQGQATVFREISNWQGQIVFPDKALPPCQASRKKDFVFSLFSIKIL